MPERDPAVHAGLDELQNALLDALARKEERICMLEALLEETRQQAALQKLPTDARKPIAIAQASSPAARPPIALAQIAAAQTFSSSADELREGYEPTARLDSRRLRRAHRALAIGKTLRVPGQAALLGLGVLAVWMGLWQLHARKQRAPGRMSATLARPETIASRAASPEGRALSRVMPVPTPTIARASAPAPLPPVVMPNGTRSAPSSAALSAAVAPAPPVIRSFMPTGRLTLPATRKAATLENKRTVSDRAIAAVQRKARPVVRSAAALRAAWAGKTGMQAARLAVTNHSEKAKTYHESDSADPLTNTDYGLGTRIKREEKEPPEIGSSTRLSTAPRRDFQTNVDHALETLDKMRGLFDTMDQRKRTKARP